MTNLSGVTFLRLQLVDHRDTRPGDVVMLNISSIVRIHPTWPSGCTVLLSDDTSLHVKAGLDELQQRFCSTGGRVHVYDLEGRP